MATRSSKSTGTIKLDMRKAQKGGGGFRYPEGEYKVKVTDVSQKTSNNGNTMLVWQGTILAPEKFKGKKVSDRLVLTENAMWRVGMLLDAIGINWSQKIHTLKMSSINGKTFGVLLADGDPYNGRINSRVADYYSEEEVDGILEGGGDEEDEDDEDVDDDSEDNDDEDVEDLEEDEDDL